MAELSFPASSRPSPGESSGSVTCSRAVDGNERRALGGSTVANTTILNSLLLPLLVLVSLVAVLVVLVVLGFIPR